MKTCDPRALAEFLGGVTALATQDRLTGSDMPMTGKLCFQSQSLPNAETLFLEKSSGAG